MNRNQYWLSWSSPYGTGGGVMGDSESLAIVFRTLYQAMPGVSYSLSMLNEHGATTELLRSHDPRVSSPMLPWFTIPSDPAKPE